MSRPYPHKNPHIYYIIPPCKDLIDIKSLTFNEYQEQAKQTAIYPHRGELLGLLYAVLGLTGEAGELANKIKKILRDNSEEITQEKINEIIEELGDVQWYTSAVASEIGVLLSEIADKNLKKLQSRKEREQIKGSGDKR